MLERLKIEWLKIKNYRTFWILFILYLIAIFGINYIVLRIQQEIYQNKQAQGMANVLLGDPPYSFPSVWQSVAHVSSWLLFIPGLLMILSVTNEYSYKTHRQNIIDGWSRFQFISVKIVAGFLLAIVSTIMVMLAGVVYGLVDGSNSFSFENFSYILYSLLQATSYIMLAILISVLVKRGVLAIGIYFLYTMVLEQILVLVLNRYTNHIGRYLPLETTDMQVHFPTFERFSKAVPGFVAPNYLLLAVIAFVYLGLYLFLTKLKFEKADL